MNSLADTITIPIEARSVFRVLAIRKVVENKELIKRLGQELSNILDSIHISKRITDDKHKNGKPKDFLRYKEPHNGDNCKEDRPICKMSEEQMCKSSHVFFKKKFDIKNGDSARVTIIDYQIPLNHSSDSAEGVIDMIGISNSETPTIKKPASIYIIEAKKWDSSEHPLRAMFEAITFWKMLQNENGDFSQFITRYNQSIKKYYNEETANERCLPDPSVSKVVPVILVHDGSIIFKKMMCNGMDDDYKKIYKELIHTIGLRCWCYKKRDSGEKSEVIMEDFTDAFGKRCGSTK